VSQATAVAALRPPDGLKAVPPFERGWKLTDGTLAPFLSYVGDDAAVNWSDELEDLHEESSRDHFIDCWTREAIVERVGAVPPDGAIADLGCSTGYLLEDLAAAFPRARLFGVDMVAPGLRKAHELVPDARLLRADVCVLPLADASLDAVVSANLLEHVPDDVGALREVRRVLRPGGRAVFVVPAGPGTYDYYDRFLGHERRYGHGELAAKARDAGLEALEDAHLGSLLYPAFWAVKKRNRRRFDDLRGAELEERVGRDIANTRDSRVGAWACGLERALLRRGIRLPFGIRGLTVVRRPEGTAG
jgi:SAM-dependent methyltransferase